MSKSIKNYRYNCTTCGLITPSHKPEPIRITLFPDWPFQQICANFFVLHSHTYLIIADRYSGWITIYHFKWRSHHFIYWKDLQSAVHHFWVPDELSTNGGLKFTPNSFKTFLKIWGVQHQKSSVEYSQPNGRAKVAVKSAKRIIYGNTGTNGSLDNNKVAQAILQYHNTPLQDFNLSPAQILFHRELRDTIPNHPSH